MGEAQAGERERSAYSLGVASFPYPFIAPQDDLIMVNMIQRMPMWTGLDRELRPIIYGAVLKQPAVAAGAPLK